MLIERGVGQPRIAEGIGVLVAVVGGDEFGKLPLACDRMFFAARSRPLAIGPDVFPSPRNEAADGINPLLRMAGHGAENLRQRFAVEPRTLARIIDRHLIRHRIEIAEKRTLRDVKIVIGQRRVPEASLAGRGTGLLEPIRVEEIREVGISGFTGLQIGFQSPAVGIVFRAAGGGLTGPGDQALSIERATVSRTRDTDNILRKIRKLAQLAVKTSLVLVLAQDKPAFRTRDGRRQIGAVGFVLAVGDHPGEIVLEDFQKVADRPDIDHLAVLDPAVFLAQILPPEVIGFRHAAQKQARCLAIDVPLDACGHLRGVPCALHGGGVLQIEAVECGEIQAVNRLNRGRCILRWAVQHSQQAGAQQ